MQRCFCEAGGEGETFLVCVHGDTGFTHCTHFNEHKAHHKKDEQLMIVTNVNVAK